jgi:hypothetical protein
MVPAWPNLRAKSVPTLAKRICVRSPMPKWAKSANHQPKEKHDCQQRQEEEYSLGQQQQQPKPSQQSE